LPAGAATQRPVVKASSERVRTSCLSNFMGVRGFESSSVRQPIDRNLLSGRYAVQGGFFLRRFHLL
jgi:hypothetical protein